MTDPYESLTFGNSLSLRVDGAIGTMSLSPNGRDAVLAGRKGLFIIDLDDPFTTPRWLHHITSWEVADVQWSPHHSVKPSWVISTSNQKALLWDLARTSNDAIAHVLHRHTRAIADINFHPLDPEVLATCSIDTFVYSWDMRTPRRPVGKWSEWRAGATQVKWSRTNQHQLVSSHDHSFFLWDSRKGALPLLRIDNAHKGKINGLDFSCVDDKLTTCSNDNTVKVWDLQRLEETEIQPSVIMRSSYPVARARSLPFGKDRCCGIMPLRGGENAVHIINYQNALTENAATGATVSIDVIPDYSFKGHQGCIKDFLWRTQRSRYTGFDSKNDWDNYQMVSWSSQDFDLKLWPHEDDIYEIASYNPLHQKIFNSLLGSPDDIGSEDAFVIRSPADSPGTELTEDALLKKNNVYNYDTYCTEPQLHMDDFSREFNADFLSSIAYFEIMRSQEGLSGSSQLNHLDWISGVRMGSNVTNIPSKHISNAIESPSGPSNLGEEVSIVGHKFPKLRFEKISVSTGHLLMTLKGPLPKVDCSDGDTTSVVGNESEVGTIVHTEKVPISSAVSKANPVESNSQFQGDNHLMNSKLTVGAGVGEGQSALSNKDSLPPSQSLISGEDRMKPDQEQSLAFIRLEIRFPKTYPYLETGGTKMLEKKRQRKHNSTKIKFNIEETHEITPEVRRIMTDGLDKIAEFYTNRFSRFCLEPCLRFLLGDKIELDENFMRSEAEELHNGAIEDPPNLIEVGNEGWADDLVNEHNAASSNLPMLGFMEDEEDEEADLIPTIGDQAVNDHAISLRDESKIPNYSDSFKERIKHDTTPLPKGCGAVWGNNGLLICFFIKKENEEKDKTETEVSGPEAKGYYGTNKIISRSLNSQDGANADDSDTELSGSETSLQTSMSSDDSFSNDWDELLQHDILTRSRVQGFFKDSMRVGDNFFSISEHKSITAVTGSAGGSASYNKSSAHGDHTSRGKRRKKTSRSINNTISVIDFSRLIPDKIELASSYRVLGDTAESLARHNGEVAQYYGHSDLAEAWKVLELVLGKGSLNSSKNTGDPHCLNAFSSVPISILWGDHPFGSTWLIENLFQYFESKLDLQMIAMMSCILHDYLVEFEEGFEDLSSARQPKPIGEKECQLRRNMLQAQGSKMTVTIANREQPTPDRTHSFKPSMPYSSSDDAWYYNLGSSENLNLKDQTSLRLITQRASYLSDLTDQVLFRRSHQHESYSKTTKISQRNLSKGQATKLPWREGQEKDKARAPPSVVFTIRNCDTYGYSNDYANSPLMNCMLLQKAKQYRAQYAEILYAWGLHYERVKILKFNYANEGMACGSSNFLENYCQFGVRFRKNLTLLLLHPMTPIRSARNNVWNSRQRNHLQNCALCVSLVTRRAIVCTNCEHIMHPQCAYTWWSGEEEIEECPTGCGCNCLKHGL